MKFIKKLQKLTENQKIVILWSIIIVFGLTFSAWRINVFVSEMKSFSENSFQEKTGLRVPQEETADEIRKSFDAVKETTEATKEGLGIIKELIQEMKALEDLEDFSFEDYPELPIENDNN